jgi:hypothetical protein
MEKKSIFENIADLKSNLGVYVESKLSYFGLTAFEKAVKAITVIAANGFVLLLMWMSLIFFSGAVAFYIGNRMDSLATGMLIVGGFYFVVALILFFLRTAIFSPIIIKILNNVFFNDDDDDDNDADHHNAKK